MRLAASADDQYPGQQAAGKTGTSTSNKSVWFAGYTPNLAAAVASPASTRSASRSRWTAS